jgi:hypothetical protein
MISEFELLNTDNQQFVKGLQGWANEVFVQCGIAYLTKFVCEKLREQGGFTYPIRAAYIVAKRARAAHYGVVYTEDIIKLVD